MGKLNGSADETKEEEGLIFEDVNNPVTDPTDAFPFIVNPVSGEIFIRQGASLTPGNVSMTITVFEERIQNIVDADGNKPFTNKEIKIIVSIGQTSGFKTVYLTPDIDPSPWESMSQFSSASDAERRTSVAVSHNGEQELPQVGDLIMIGDRDAPGGSRPFTGRSLWWGVTATTAEISQQAVQVNSQGIVIDVDIL